MSRRAADCLRGRSFRHEMCARAALGADELRHVAAVCRMGVGGCCAGAVIWGRDRARACDVCECGKAALVCCVTGSYA